VTLPMTIRVAQDIHKWELSHASRGLCLQLIILFATFGKADNAGKGPTRVLPRKAEPQVTLTMSSQARCSLKCTLKQNAGGPRSFLRKKAQASTMTERVGSIEASRPSMINGQPSHLNMILFLCPWACHLADHQASGSFANPRFCRLPG